MSSPNYTGRSPRADRLLPSKAWAPAFFTPRIWKSTDGIDAVEFAREHFVVTKGVRAGEPLDFLPWQRWLLASLLERRETPEGKAGRLRYRRALIGLPRKQGKSLIGSTLGIYGMVAGEAGAEVYAVAADRQQARIIFNEAKQQVLMSPMLMQECKVYRDALEMPRFGSIFRVLSSDVKGQAGLNPSLVLFDELWTQSTDDLWDQLTLGSGARVEPLVVAITTAGYDLETTAGRLYQRGKRIASGEEVDDTFGMWWWESPADCDIHDRKAWKISNPNIEPGLMDLDDMEVASRQSAENSFRRWRLNQWARTSAESWLPAGAWDQCASDLNLDPDLPVWVGIDMAMKHDSIAVVTCQPQGDRIVMRSKIWRPADDGVDVAGVEAYLRDLHLQFQVREFVFDPAYFLRSAEALSDDGLPMVEFPQSGARMVPACGNAYELIVAGRVAHDGSPTFTDHVLSAAQRMSDSGWRLSKGKSKRKIDACIAMVMALDRATSKPREVVAPSVLDIWS